MALLYDYQGNPVVNDLPTGKVRVPQPFNDVVSSEEVYVCQSSEDVQGCAANGNIVYYANIANNTINKYDIRTETLTSVSQPTIGHGNGATYCDKDHCVYVVSGTSRNILKIDGDTLALVDTVTPWHSDPLYPGDTSWNYTGIAWNRNLQVFYLKSADIFHIYDYDFNYLGRLTLENFPTNVTNQAMGTDGIFIYYIFCEETSYNVDAKQHMYVYDLDGNFIKDVKPYIAEFEDLDYNGCGEYYISINQGSLGRGAIRKLTNPLSAIVPTTNGTYTLKATVSNSRATYSWESVT